LPKSEPPRRKYQSKTKRPFLFEIDGAEFATMSRVPGVRFVEFVELLPQLQGEQRNIAAVGELGSMVRGMFESVMEPEEFERFWKWAKTSEGPDFETLFEVLSDMVADDSDRPTGRPARSPRGPGRTGDTSTED